MQLKNKQSAIKKQTNCNYFRVNNLSTLKKVNHCSHYKL